MGIVQNPKKYMNYSKREEKYLPTDSLEYFQKIRDYLKTHYINNIDNDNNLSIALEEKSFLDSNTVNNDNGYYESITWLDYLTNYLQEQSLHQYSWASKLANKIDQQIFYKEHLYQSLMFYNAFSLETKPKILTELEEEKEPQLIFKAIHELKNDTREDLELRMTRNLGGSFQEMNYDDLLPDDPNVQFQIQRNNCKNVVKIIKDLLLLDDHPIMTVINLFADEFHDYLLNEIDILKKNKNISPDELKAKDENITKQLQDFILKLNTSLKLFYCETIDYNCFGQEKDELINMLTTIIFQKEKIYDSMFQFYEITTKDFKNDLQSKFTDLKDCTPQNLGIADKFSLNEETLKLKTSLINKKKASTNSNNNNKSEVQKQEPPKKVDAPKKEVQLKSSVIKENNEEEEEDKEEGKEGNKDEEVEDKKDEDNKENQEEDKEKNNDEDKEEEEELRDYFNDIDTSNLNKNRNSNIQSNNNLKTSKSKDFGLSGTSSNFNVKQASTLNHIKTQDSELDIGSNILYNDAYKPNLYVSFQNNARNTVTAFNNRQLNFPKLHMNVRDTINREKDYIPTELKKNRTPPPYISAIEILQSIKKFRAPFEKMLVIASISDEITECVSNFWGDISEYAKNDFLGIEVDELLTIFLYIIIKSQMPELSVFTKMIKNFTTSTTKGTTVGFYYASLESSLALINDLKDIKNPDQKEEQLANARYTLANYNMSKIW